MAEKKIAIMGAGVGCIGIGGLHSQIQPVPYRKELSVEDVEKWAKSILSSHKPGPRTIVLGYDTVVGYRMELGDDAFYAFVTSKDNEIQCGEKAYNYIEKFIKWYELKQSQKHKRRK